MISITPHEMKFGKITSIKVTNNENTETIEINPIDFSDIDSIKQTIINHVEAKSMLDEAYQEYMDVKNQFELIESKFKELTATKPVQINPPIKSERKIKPPETVEESIVISKEPTPSLIKEERLLHIQDRIDDIKNLSSKEPLKPIITPDSEAKRLVNNLQIHMAIFEKSSAFNRNELQAEVSKHVPENMVDETTDKVLVLLEEQGIVKSKAGIFKKLKQMVSKK